MTRVSKYAEAGRVGMSFRLGHLQTFMAFLVGILVGGAATTFGAQANRIPGNNGVNHVGINVTNMNEAIA